MTPTVLERVAAAIAESKLECVLVGGAAAALLGCPITTLDMDFFFRPTALHLRRLRRLAGLLRAEMGQPFLPASEMYRLVSDEMQLDFLPQMDGIRSFASLRSRAITLPIGDQRLRVAALDDIITSKRAANRDKDRAVLPLLEKTLLVRRQCSALAVPIAKLAHGTEDVRRGRP